MQHLGKRLNLTVDYSPLIREGSLESWGLRGDLGGTGGGTPRPARLECGLSLRTAGKIQVVDGCSSSWQSSSELLEGSLSALGVANGETLANPPIASKTQPIVRCALRYTFKRWSTVKYQFNHPRGKHLTLKLSN